MSRLRFGPTGIANVFERVTLAQWASENSQLSRREAVLQSSIHCFRCISAIVYSHFDLAGVAPVTLLSKEETNCACFVELRLQSLTELLLKDFSDAMTNLS